ncbi:proline-rich protein 15 [Elgaria multicarinata webbii]|uniref:proline-rich protein 15 n=1 Tax=Elgaria multicarinata webbii TaxID=159646 RepID=UPI002FCCFC2B
MAESASAAAAAAAAAAPSGGPGAKGGSSGAWWKSLGNRKKPKEALAAAPSTAWPPLQPAEPLEPLHGPPSPSDSRDTQQPPSGSRRNLKISRSGRFKEKRKVRAPLLAESPQKLFEGGGAGVAGSTTPAHPGEETPCQ